MTHTELYYFLAKCLVLDEHSGFVAEVIRKTKREQIPWERFVFMASNQLVLPLVYYNFTKHNIIEHLPVELSAHLKHVYTLNRERNLEIIAQIDLFLPILQNEGINPVFMKGTACIMDDVYCDIGLRMVGDIDFLVKEEDFFRAAEILKSLEYFPKRGITEPLQDWSKHYPRMMKEGEQADVEIHKLAVTKRCNKKFPASRLFNAARQSAQNSALLVPDDAAKITQSFIHNQLGHLFYFNGQIPFRDLYDSYCLQKKVAVNNIIGTMPYKNKAIAYFALAEEVLNLPQYFVLERNLKSRFHIIKHNLYSSFPIVLAIIQIIRMLYLKWIINYIGKTIRSVTDKQLRNHILKNLTKMAWYKKHLRFYRKLFFSLSRNSEVR